MKFRIASVALAAMILVLVTNCVLGTGVAPTGREATVPPGRGCPAGSPAWMGLAVCDERPRRGYARADFGSGYSGLEDEIIERLPKAGRARVYAPYTCTLFDIRSDGTAASDIEHIVSLAEAWDSGLHPARRQAFAADLANLTIARPDVNRNRKRDRDAAEWQPDRNRGWFATRVVAVKRKYGLSVDPAERDALRAMMAADRSRSVACRG